MLTFTVVDPDELRNRPGRTATDAELRLARRAGREAYEGDGHAAPSLSAEIRALVDVDTPVGEPRTVQIFAAYTEGWSAAADAAVAEAFADMTPEQARITRPAWMDEKR